MVTRIGRRSAAFEQWRLLGLLVVCVLINYLDRGNLSVAASDITRDLSLTPAHMGLLLSSFYWTYAVCQLLAGWLLDRFDVYRVLAAGFFLMSAATALTSLVNGFALLLAFRLMVGLGASVAYPAFSKILASDYLESQRGKANAFIDAGSKLAPALGMILGGLIMVRFGWRPLFLILGLGAMVWIPFWFGWRPRAHLALETAAPVVRPPGMLRLLRHRSVWGTFFGLYSLNSAWYFLITWFPYYLIRERHFSTERMAVFGSLPFWLLAASTTLSGWASDRWILRGATPTLVRKTFLIAGMLGCTLLLPAALAPNDTVSMALFTIACFAFGMATSNHWAITQTMAGPAAAGKWTGMQNAFGNLAGVTTPWITGVIVGRTQSFHWAFVLVAVMVILGACSYGLVVGRLEPIRWDAPEASASL
ncbi:MAG: MFS transporter [Bryobacterales bacterium]|nr:MFS transporter [Bryobacterales bacterium]